MITGQGFALGIQATLVSVQGQRVLWRSPQIPQRRKPGKSWIILISTSLMKTWRSLVAAQKRSWSSCQKA